MAGRISHSRSVAAVALPDLKHRIPAPEAHLTLVFAGEIEDADITGLRSTVRQLARNGAPFTAQIIGTEMFGDNNDEPVVLVDHPEFKAMRRQLEQHNQSQWPFRPHVAITSLDDLHRMPAEIGFNRLGLWLGDEREHYWMGSGNRTQI